MSFFLKKTRVKTKSDKGLYLQVYESYYDKERHISANRSVRKIGYVEDLRQGGIDDPVAHFSAEVEGMNEAGKDARSAKRMRQIAEDPTRFVGHFLLAGVMAELNVKGYLDLLQSVRGFRFSLL
jgi:hypothetical protein